MKKWTRHKRNWKIKNNTHNFQWRVNHVRREDGIKWRRESARGNAQNKFTFALHALTYMAILSFVLNALYLFVDISVLICFRFCFKYKQRITKSLKPFIACVLLICGNKTLNWAHVLCIKNVTIISDNSA